MRADLRFAARLLAKLPGFTFIALLACYLPSGRATLIEPLFAPWAE